MKALALLPLLVSPARADCVIDGSEVTLLRIAVKGGIVVDVAGVPVVARPGRDATAVEVGGPIAFAGTVVHPIWYSAAREIKAGQVTLSRAAHLIGTRADGDVLVGDAVIYADDVMQGEIKRADELVANVRVRCDALSLDWFRDDHPPAITGDGSAWGPRAKTNVLWLHAQPKTGAPAVRYSYPSCGDGSCIALAGIARRGGWLEVGVRNEGVMVTGWVPVATMKRFPDDNDVLGKTYGCSGSHENHVRFVLPGPPPRDAHLEIGTQIYAAPNTGIWATVQQEIEATVSYAAGDFWARVDRMPGLDLREGEAYVLVSSLRTP